MQRAVVTEQKMRNLNVSHCKNLFISKPDETDAVAPPVYAQNDRLYVSATTTKRDVDAERLLRTRPTFSHSVMVSVAVSKLGFSDMFFVEPGAYWCILPRCPPEAADVARYSAYVRGLLHIPAGQRTCTPCTGHHRAATT